MIDLRSDTVSKPSKKMLEAMMNAPVGDDVFKEDPTVNILEEKLAKMFGMEAALFCPSGTMCNQIAIKVHTVPMDEIIIDKLSHIYYYETAGYSANSGCGVKLIDGDKGRISAQQVLDSIQPDFDWLPVSKLVVIENTCNKGGGTIYDINSLKEISKVCEEKGLKLHMDGARFFNAMIASGTRPLDYVDLFDSISICLSKGLGAPIGSVLLGNKSFIKRARKIRKAFGGGMRQAGYLAAAGLYALENNIARLAIDHQNAKKIADKLESQNYVSSVVSPQTNIVIFDLEENISNDLFLEFLKQNEILAVQFGPRIVRMVTHLDVSNSDINKLCEVLPKFTKTL